MKFDKLKPYVVWRIIFAFLLVFWGSILFLIFR